MPPPTARASVSIQYHSRILASTMAKAPLHAPIAHVEFRCVTASRNATSAGLARACSQSATRASSAASELSAVTFQAIARNRMPATMNALHPAIASARGERLRGCGSRSSTAPPGAVFSPSKDFARSALESSATQRVLLHLDAPRRDAQQVERVRLLARAPRGGSARLDEKQGNSIQGLGDVPDPGRMQVACEQDIDPAVDQLLERHERMMGHQDRDALFMEIAKLLAHEAELLVAHPAALEDERARGVDPQHRDLLVDKARLQILRDDAAVPR